MIDPLTLALLSGGVNVLGNLFSRPRRPTYDADRLYRILEGDIMSSAEAMGSSARSAVGQSLAGRGLSGGVAAQAIGQADADIRAQALSDLTRARVDLLREESMVKDRYRQARTDWVRNIFGDVAMAGGGIAGAMESRSNITELGKILASIGIGGSAGETISGGASFQKIGGDNPMAHMDTTTFRAPNWWNMLLDRQMPWQTNQGPSMWRW